MIGHALITGLVPSILLLMLLEIVGQSLLVLGGLIPNQLVADIIEQQAIMIFLNQVTHLRIDSRERVCTLVQQLLLGNSIAGGCHLRIQLTLCDAVTHILLFHKTEDIVLMEFKGLKLLALFHKDDMPTVR